MTDASSRRGKTPRENDDETLNGLLAPTEAEARAGIRGLRVEHEDVTAEQVRRRRRGRRNALIAAALVFAVAFFVSGSIIGPRLGLFHVSDYSGSGNGTAVSFTVSKGEGNATIASNLEAKDVIADADKFVEVYQDKANGKYIQPGTFQLQQHMSSESALSALLGDDGSAQHYVAINQGQRKSETFTQLAEATGIPESSFEALDKNPSQFGIPAKFPSLEGFLHPGEYRFATDATAKDVIQQMVDKTKADLKDAGVTGDDRIFHVVTEASILEFEATPSDYQAVAGAIENRINHPNGETQGFIQSDATVAYGLNKKTYQITTAEKQDASNKYNTFAHKGLPVGPIGSPGASSIKAAANPDKNDYYFWVTVNLDTGETKFAKTYAEHQKNVEEYEQWCSENSGKCS